MKMKGNRNSRTRYIFEELHKKENKEYEKEYEKVE